MKLLQIETPYLKVLPVSDSNVPKRPPHLRRQQPSLELGGQSRGQKHAEEGKITGSAGETRGRRVKEGQHQKGEIEQSTDDFESGSGRVTRFCTNSTRKMGWI